MIPSLLILIITHSNCKLAGGATYDNGYTIYDEIFTYNSSLDIWNITGRMSQPRAWHVLATLADSKVCDSSK